MGKTFMGLFVSLKECRTIPLLYSLMRNFHSDPGQVAQWWECLLVHQKVAGLFPGQGPYLGCGFDIWLGCYVWGDNQLMFLSHIDVFFSFSLSLSPSFPPPFPSLHLYLSPFPSLSPVPPLFQINKYILR